MRVSDELINGVSRDQYGLWCQHGRRLMVPDSADLTPYPATVLADPWPCSVCTPDRLAADMQAEAAAWDQERWDEYRAMVGGAS